MTDTVSSTEYQPPKVWTHETENGGTWASINRPTAGARTEQTLPKGTHPFQLYSAGTPNGQKVTIMLEELLALGINEAEYDAWLINIGQGDQFGSGFVALNPNSKIPAIVDYSTDEPTVLFESGHIVMYLAEKFGHFLPKELNKRTEVLNWLFWLQGAAPYLGGGFGHFYAYAPEKFEYPINRFTMEIKRMMDLLDKRLIENTYLGGNDYSIADIVTWPWFGNLVLGRAYDAGEFLDVDSYCHLKRWAETILTRPAVQRGQIVNRPPNDNMATIKERHSASDIDHALAK